MEKKILSVHLCHTVFDIPKPLQFHLQIQIRKWKTDWLWQFEMHYVCCVHANENRMVPNLGMVLKLKLLIWNCQDTSLKKIKKLFFSPSFGEHQFQGFKIIISPYYQRNLPLHGQLLFLKTVPPLLKKGKKRPGTMRLSDHKRN